MNICRRCIFMLILAVLSAGVIRMPRAAAQELIVNGGFEEPALDYGYWNWFWSVPGWTTFADAVEIQNHVAGSPHQGDQHIELDTYTPSGITQSVPTQGGATYQLTFAYSPRPGVADNAIQVWWNGEVVDTLNRSGVDLSDTDWTVHSYNLAGIAPTSHLEFRDVSTPDGGFGGYIDTVSLVGVNVVVNPAFTPPGGTYANAQVVTLTCATPGATIRYTTDGSEPGPSSPVAPSGATFMIEQTGATLRAYATRKDLMDSGVTSASYELAVAPPVFSPRYAGTPVTVAMTCETSDAGIYYTLDGSDPTPGNGQLYSGPILVNGTTTVRAIGVRPGFVTSQTTSATYGPAHIVHYGLSAVPLASGSSVALDMDSNSSPDVTFGNGELFWLGGMCITDANGFLVSALANGVPIGPDSSLWGPCYECKYATLYWGAGSQGDWPPGGVLGFVGVRFVGADSLLHYGWILVQSADAPDGTAYVLDWAYEATPETPIGAGDTGENPCPTRFYRQPEDQDVLEATTASFSVAASGQNLRFQWLRDGAPLMDGDSVSGATTRALSLGPVGRFDGASISVVVESDCGSVMSAPALLTVTPDCAPLNGGAVLLDGVDDHVQIPGAPDLNFIAGDSISIEAWIRPWDEGVLYIVSKEDQGTGARNYAIETGYGGNLIFTFSDSDTSGTSSFITFDGGVTLDRWHHIALTYTFGTAQATWYVDGRQVDGYWWDGDPVGRTPFTGPDPVCIGGCMSLPSGDLTFRGRIDEVRIWNVARTATQIASDFSHTIDPASPGLVAYYRLDETSGGVARDSTRNHHDASIESGARITPALGCCPTELTDEPRDQTLASEFPARLTVGATGPGLRYQWERDGAPTADDARISGSHSPQLVIARALPSDSARYRAIVISDCGTLVSREALLSVINDCNGNGVPDAEDIASGTSHDCDANGAPDECEARSALSTSFNNASEYILGGKAEIVDGGVRLTESSPGQSGAAALSPIHEASARIDVSFDLQGINESNGGGDGMSFNLVPPDFDPESPIDGLGPINPVSHVLTVGFDVRRNLYPQPSNHFIRLKYDGTLVASAQMPFYANGSSFRARVVVQGRTITVTLIFRRVLYQVFHLDIPGYVPFRSRVVFGAMCRRFPEEHWLDNVSVEFTPRTDQNSNGVPDACECRVDLNNDGVVDSQDFFLFLYHFFGTTGDFNDDGVANSQDFFDFLNAFFVGCA